MVPLPLLADASIEIKDKMPADFSGAGSDPKQGIWP